MKKLTLAIVLAVIPMIGCAQLSEPEGKSFCEGASCTEPDPDPQELPKLKGAYIAGHLGSYWDCPDEAFNGPNSGAPSDGAAPAEGDCAGDCTSFSSCETAQMTLSLSNGGDTDATNILVDQIELFGTDGVSRAVLPLSATIDTSTNETFDGSLAPGEEVVLRVEFQGPYNSWELLQPAADDTDSSGDRAAGGGGIVKTTLSSDNHADLTVESGELYDVPSVDT